MGPHLPPSLLRMLRPSPSDPTHKPPSSDRHFVTWTDQEDEILRHAVATFGTEKWSVIASQFHNKTSRQCRRRWNTYLSVDCKKGGWSPEEDQLLLEAQKKFGNRWTEIAKVVPGRTDNAVKNRFSALGKKQAKKQGAFSTQVCVEGNKNVACRRVLEPISDIVNKRSRLDDSVGTLVDIQKQIHPQYKKFVKPSRLEQSMADRAHPVHSRKAPSYVTYSPSKPLHTVQKLPNNYYFTNKSVTNEGKVGTADLQVSRASHEIITPPRVSALSQNFSVSDPPVEASDCKIKIWDNGGGIWKPLDWDANKSMKTTNYPLGHAVREAATNTCFEHYCHPYVTHISSLYPIVKEFVHQHQEQQDLVVATPLVQRERRTTNDQEGFDCSSSSNVGSHQNEDSTSAQNDFSSLQVNQTRASEDNEVDYRSTNCQGFGFKEGSDPSAALMNSTFSDVSSAVDFAWYTEFTMDEIPSPKFSDSEQQFLLSAFD